MSPGPKRVSEGGRGKKTNYVFLIAGCFSHLDFTEMKLLAAFSTPEGAAKLSRLRLIYRINICILCSQTTYSNSVRRQSKLDKYLYVSLHTATT